MTKYGRVFRTDNPNITVKIEEEREDKALMVVMDGEREIFALEIEYHDERDPFYHKGIHVEPCYQSIPNSRVFKDRS